MESTSWMVFFMNLSEMVTGNVGIILGGRDINMAKHHLNGSQISPAFEEVAGKRVPKTVRSDFFFDASLFYILF